MTLAEATGGPASRLAPGAGLGGRGRAHGVVFSGSEDGTVHAFPTTCATGTCPALWSADAGGLISGAPAVANGKLFVGTAEGDLVAYGLSS